MYFHSITLTLIVFVINSSKCRDKCKIIKLHKEKITEKLKEKYKKVFLFRKKAKRKKNKINME